MMKGGAGLATESTEFTEEGHIFLAGVEPGNGIGRCLLRCD